MLEKQFGDTRGLNHSGVLRMNVQSMQMRMSLRALKLKSNTNEESNQAHYCLQFLVFVCLQNKYLGQHTT